MHPVGGDLREDLVEQHGPRQRSVEQGDERASAVRDGPVRAEHQIEGDVVPIIPPRLRDFSELCQRLTQRGQRGRPVRLEAVEPLARLAVEHGVEPKVVGELVEELDVPDRVVVGEAQRV